MTTLNLIHAELKNGKTGNTIEEGVFLSYRELGIADKDMREKNGSFWSGSLETNIALNRFRHKQCMFCGVLPGSNHRENCRVGIVATFQDMEAGNDTSS